jgi:hypothetical protein
MAIRNVAVALLAMTTVVPALAQPAVYPVPTGTETAHFRNGVPTLHLETDTGGVEVTPLPFDHGHATFGVAIFNKTIQPANFGIESITAESNGVALAVLSEEELEKRAKSRAMWTQIGMVALTGVAAGVAASAHTTSYAHGHVSTPFGTSSWSASYRDYSLGSAAAAGVSAAGAAGVVDTRNRLDATLDELSHDIVQTTTVMGMASYGGRIVVEKPKSNTLPYDVRLSIVWNGRAYPFVFRVTDEGKNMPAAYPPPPAVPLTAVPLRASALPLPAPQPLPAPRATLTPLVAPAQAPVAAPLTMAAATPGQVSYDAGRAAAAAALAATRTRDD